MNRLSRETSPYLLQHADNPVDWYPWGREALEAARQTDRPLFLSIGYSSCHWCHVMERESFSEPEVGELLNRNFVAVKVDREERPDLDAQYMIAAQMMMGHGGWPLNVVLTPQRKPFFAFCYLPRGGRPGRPGLIEQLRRLADAWQNQRNLLEETAELLTERMRLQASVVPPSAVSPAEVRRLAFERLARQFDWDAGGFGSAPKFPEPAVLLFLLDFFRREGEEQALQMAERTLLAIRAGGIYDQVGFGIHRYSTDGLWRVPHFEKMLSDQALMSMTYLEAGRLTGRKIYLRTADEILQYAVRDLGSGQGVFFSAEDADSEGREGGYYTWKAGELRQLLGEELFGRLCENFEIFEGGNFRNPGELKPGGENILFYTQPLFVGANGSEDRIAEQLQASLLSEELRGRLWQARQRRKRPLRDEKIVTGVNGLMLAALARAGVQLGRKDYLEAAGKAARWLIDNHARDGLVHHSTGGKKGGPAFAEDYAFLTWGLLEVFEAGGEKFFLDQAARFSAELMQKFSDGGTIFQTAAQAADILVRLPADTDSAVPSAAAVQTANLMRLAGLTGEQSHREAATNLSKRLNSLAAHFPGALMSYLAWS